MHIEPFAMERMQSTWENQVEFNLSESGVHPLHIADVVDDPTEWELLLHQELGYPQTNGTIPLRAAIAALYPGATADHVQVTNGGAEANFVVTWRLLEPGDEAVVMVPNYMQTWGLARAFAGTVREWPLGLSPGGRGWVLDLDQLARLVSARTRLIVVCNPNNPTGARFGDNELEAISTIAAHHGCWILSDEIYRGAELDGRETPSMWGRYERVVVTSGLSKAYGLPGLRIGWIVATPELVASTWAYHDYTTIAPGALNDRLARFALAPPTRARILDRTRSILGRNLPLVTSWLDARSSRFTYAPPDAGAIVYAHYDQDVSSTVLTTRLRTEKSVLVVPGDHFGMDRYLRLGYGGDARCLQEGLARIAELMD
jgi:hypothetical protein